MIVLWRNLFIHLNKRIFLATTIKAFQTRPSHLIFIFRQCICRLHNTLCTMILIVCVHAHACSCTQRCVCQREGGRKGQRDDEVFFLEEYQCYSCRPSNSEETLSMKICCCYHFLLDMAWTYSWPNMKWSDTQHLIHCISLSVFSKFYFFKIPWCNQGNLAVILSKSSVYGSLINFWLFSNKTIF